MCRKFRFTVRGRVRVRVRVSVRVRVRAVTVTVCVNRSREYTNGVRVGDYFLRLHTSFPVVGLAR